MSSASLTLPVRTILPPQPELSHPCLDPPVRRGRACGSCPADDNQTALAVVGAMVDRKGLHQGNVALVGRHAADGEQAHVGIIVLVERRQIGIQGEKAVNVVKGRYDPALAAGYARCVKVLSAVVRAGQKGSDGFNLRNLLELRPTGAADVDIPLVDPFKEVGAGLHYDT